MMSLELRFGEGGLNLSLFCATLNHSQVMGKKLKKKTISPSVPLFAIPATIAMMAENINNHVF